MMIDAIRNYFSKCPYLDQYTTLAVDYLEDNVTAYSLNENASYEPIMHQFIRGAEKQFLFTFDSKLYWNEEIQNNIANSKFYENVKKWLKENSDNHIFPNIPGVYKIEAITNGYIFATNSDEAVYRIQCKVEYFEEV